MLSLLGRVPMFTFVADVSSIEIIPKGLQQLLLFFRHERAARFSRYIQHDDTLLLIPNFDKWTHR